MSIEELVEWLKQGKEITGEMRATIESALKQFQSDHAALHTIKRLCDENNSDYTAWVTLDNIADIVTTQVASGSAYDG